MHSREQLEHESKAFPYEVFLEYLESKKERKTLDTVLEILAKGSSEKDFFVQYLLPSLEDARIIWKSQGDFRENYQKALNFLISKWQDSFRNSLGEFKIDPTFHLKPLLNKYSAFIEQQKKEQEKKHQQELLETLQGELNQEHSPLFSLQQKELDELENNIAHLSQNTKKILNELGTQALFNLIFSYGQIKNTISREQLPTELYEKDDDIRELYGNSRNVQSPLQTFENNFFSQFKNLIDPKNKLNEEEIKNILEELTSTVNKFHHSILKPKGKRENGINPFIDHNEEIREEIALLEEAFNAGNGENPELRRQIAELRSLL
ncbi:MAG: hypothetical protein DLD55_03210 [candidate division SR1 bacterium]|nr:MAG: hypothetical protein DLD55_03210 [candidate division SR1 bacterium]